MNNEIHFTESNLFQGNRFLSSRFKNELKLNSHLLASLPSGHILRIGIHSSQCLAYCLDWLQQQQQTSHAKPWEVRPTKCFATLPLLSPFKSVEGAKIALVQWPLAPQAEKDNSQEDPQATASTCQPSLHRVCPGPKSYSTSSVFSPLYGATPKCMLGTPEGGVASPSLPPSLGGW